jgi:replicative DNA helicase
MIDANFADRELPRSVEAEQSILGAILLDGNVDQAGDISSGHFALDSNQRIFATMAGMREENRPIDIVTLSDELRNKRALDSIGGVAYLASLMEGRPRHLPVDEYVRIVKDCAVRRQVINELSLTLAKAYDHDLDADELIADADKRLLEISSGESTGPANIAAICARQFPALVEESKTRKPKGIPTGLDVLDRKLCTGGWMPGELTVIAARPGRGKSWLALQTIVACGRNKIPALLFSLEMSESQVLRRILAVMTGIPFSRFTKPYMLTADDWKLLEEARTELNTFPLTIDSTSKLTAQELIARARMAVKRYGVRLIAVDYLQILSFKTDKPEARFIAVGDAANALASLAKDENVAAIAVASLTEKGSRAHDALPSMADIRQSGDVQYCAANVILLHREAENEQSHGWPARIIVEKQRQGEEGSVLVNFTGCRFESTDPQPQASTQTRMFAAD